MNVDSHYLGTRDIGLCFCMVVHEKPFCSEQMLLSIEAQLCTRIECKTFRPRRPSSVARPSWSKRFALNTCAQLYFNAQQHLF